MRKIILIMLLLVIPCNAMSAIIIAESASYAHVNAAVSAASAGDTVSIPAGEATWSSQLVINKSLILNGAGINSTIITSAYEGYLIYYSTNGNNAFEMSNITIDCNSVGNSGALYIYNSSATTPLQNLKIHHNKFKNVANIAIQPYKLVFGVVYLNQFENNQYDFKPLGDNTNSWTLYPGIENVGTANYFYIEDNTSISANLIILASGEGARWVYRYNTADVSGAGNPAAFNVHGDTLNRSIVAHELYNNTLTGGTNYYLIDHKGGVGIEFNNTSEGNTGYIRIMEEYATCSDPSGCTGDNSGCGDEVWHSYIWNNLKYGTSTILTVEESDTYNCISEGVNWWDDYSTGTTFTKAVASGRNESICTIQDVYWETDMNRLYRCTAANTWTFVYTPYTYPHPLRGEGAEFQPGPGKRTGGSSGGGTFR